MEAERKSGTAATGELLFECLIAAGTLSRWTLLLERPPGSPEQRARSFVFVSGAGFVLGVLLVFVEHALASVLGVTARSLAVLAFSAMLTGGVDLFGIADTVGAVRAATCRSSPDVSQRGLLGSVGALAWFLARVSLFSCIHDPPARSAALVMATMLSRWSIVPLGYGLRPLEPQGLGLPYEGGIRFREFALSSAVALGLALGLYENLGLAAVVVTALVTLGARIVLSQRLGGAAGYTLVGGAALCDLAIFGLVAALEI